MKETNLWAVQANNDTTEGRGNQYDVFYTEKKDVAEAISNNSVFYGNYGVMGTKGGIYVRSKTIKIFESVSDYLISTRGEVAKKALSKLTTEEKEALGLVFN